MVDHEFTDDGSSDYVMEAGIAWSKCRVPSQTVDCFPSITAISHGNYWDEDDKYRRKDTCEHGFTVIIGA